MAFVFVWNQDIRYINQEEAVKQPKVFICGLRACNVGGTERTEVEIVLGITPGSAGLRKQNPQGWVTCFEGIVIRC